MAKEKKEKKVISGPIYDARELGGGKTLVLGLQHMFAMFGATVLVPLLTGLSVSSTLLFAGVGTLLFHLLTKGKVPAFLGSSFAFLAGYFTVAATCETAGITNFSAYAGVGVACAGLLYLVLAALFKIFGAKKVMRFFPPVVTGPIIISIGLTLSATAIDSCQSNWWLALVAIAVIIVCNIWGKGMIKIIPILLGVVISYIVAAATGNVDFSSVHAAKWFGLPVEWNNTAFSLFGNANLGVLISSIITIMPIALATIIEHIGDVCAISSTVNRNYIESPGLHRTLCGDGLATALAALFGAPANTTYGENTGVLALTKVFDPKVIRIAAYFAILFSFSPKFAALINSMPTAVVGGVSLVLYGMISAVGVRNVVESKVDFSKSRNIIIAAIILVLAIGIKYYDADLGNAATGAINFTIANVKISLSGLAVAALAGVILNAILPGKDYEFKAEGTEETK